MVQYRRLSAKRLQVTDVKSFVLEFSKVQHILVCLLPRSVWSQHGLGRCKHLAKT